MSDNEHSSAAADYVESEATDPRYGWSETAHEEISANKLNDRSSLHDGHVQPQGSSKISSSDNDAGKTQPIVNLGVHMRCNGNPWYSLTWDMLSILISICFISTSPYDLLWQNEKRTLTVHSTRCMRFQSRREDAKCLVEQDHPCYFDCAFFVACPLFRCSWERSTITCRLAS